MLLNRRQRQRAHLNLAADQVGQHRADALVRNVRRRDTGFIKKHRSGQVQDGAVS